MTHLPLAIDPDHPAFAGHFPSRPIVPGVVLLDHGLRALAAHRAPADASRVRIGAAKFLSFVLPGEAVRLEVDAAVDATSTVTAADVPAADAPASGVPASGVPAANVPASGVTYRFRIFAGPADAERLALSASVSYGAR